MLSQNTLKSYHKTQIDRERLNPAVHKWGFVDSQFGPLYVICERTLVKTEVMNTVLLCFIKIITLSLNSREIFG